MPRHARLDAPGTLHHVMIRGIEGKAIFRDDRDRKEFVTRLGNLSKETGTRVLAWSLLKNPSSFFQRPFGLGPLEGLKKLKIYKLKITIQPGMFQ